MRSTRSVSVDLPDDMVDLIRTKIASGDYASESDVVQEGLRTLQDRDAAIEDWLRDEVAASHDEFRKDPSIAIPASDIAAALDLRLQTRLALRKPG